MACAGFLSLLDEKDAELLEYALQNLNTLAPVAWAEMAEAAPKIDELSKTESFSHQRLAALVVSKVYYFLDRMEEALESALCAGEFFDVTQNNEYVCALVAKAIDSFVQVRIRKSEAKSLSCSGSSCSLSSSSSSSSSFSSSASTSSASASSSSSVKTDPRLKTIVYGMFDRCFNEGKHKEALGVALESRSLKKINQAISKSDNVSEMLLYCFEICMRQVANRDFRHSVFRLLVTIYSESSSPDYVHIVKILVFLNDGKRIAGILQTLLSGDEVQRLLAYQLAFDLAESATQELLANVSRQLLATGGDEEQRKKIATILTGSVSLSLYIDFLAKNNKTDLLILKNIRESLEVRNSVCHNATILAHSIMQAGTTKDTFLRENLEWLARSTHWAKFSATAGLGVIHKGQVGRALKLMQSYLPTPNSSRGAYCEGGALYALGLIHTNHGAEIVPYLTEALGNAINSANNIMQSGACLGLGVAAMGTQNEAIREQLSTILRSENAVAGEAAGIAIGLVMLGSANQLALEEMIRQAHLTEHEKIIRGIAIGCALVMYGQEEAADTLIEQLVGDKDPILRYGGMFAIGMAYCGTANNDAIRRLLHFAVSDVNDDVRRAAVLCLGFLLFRQPELCPKLVSLLASSYNPHVRYGATLAVGISCAGTASKAALELLEPMTRDDKDFVRQGAYIAVAMVLIQTSTAEEPAVTKFRSLFAERIAYKHELLMAKFGAILASGIIDAGGRNVTISLQSQSGHLNLPGIVGLCVFTQYWYWYPLIHFLSMSFAPTTMIGLNGDLKMPSWSFVSNAPPSRFAYPEPYKAPAAAAPTSVKTAVLSTAKKARQRAAQKAADKQTETKDAVPKEKEAPKEPAKESAKEPEPDSEVLQNPARVTHSQLQVISFQQDTRWLPVDMARCKTGGIIVLRDTTPSEPVSLAGESDPASSASAAITTPVPAATFTTAEPSDQAPPPGGLNDLPPEDFDLLDDDFQ